MAPNPTSSAAARGGSDVSSAAVAAAKKEKRSAAAAAAMAPNMQSQVQKWAKMTAELGGGRTPASDENDDGENAETPGRPRKKARTGEKTKTAKSKKRDQDGLPFSKQVRAPHRRDRYVSFGIGRGLGRNSMGEKAAAMATATSSLPPTCLLCLVRFDSRQQLRDHEALSSNHRRQLRDGVVRKTALQRYAKIAEDDAAATAAAAAKATDPNEDDTMVDQDKESQPQPTTKAVRPPVHIKRLPRRRGDLAPTYTSARTRDPASVAAAVAAVNKAAEEVESQKNDVSLKEEDEEKKEDDQSTPDTPALHIRPLLRMRPAAPSTAGTTTAQYRDRARERRLVYGDSTKNKSSKRAKNDATVSTTATPSKGAALLSKMGWTAGQGLGAQGGGLTEAIAPSVYRSGVGLGAQGGKLGDAADVAARRTESKYADFVQQTRDTARQRLMALEKEEAEAAAAKAEEEAAAAEAAAKAEQEAAKEEEDEDAIFKDED
ncbi:hypothetical protein Sste5344_006675 [Sporothrix stenoceras]